MSMYPRQLLPKAEYRRRLDFNQLCSGVPTLTVVRRSDVAVCYLEGTRILEEDCITRRVYDYSMNFVGGGFDAYEHIKYRQTGVGNDSWDREVILSEEEIDSSYETIEVCYPIFFAVRDIHHITIPYKRHFNKKKDMWQSLKPLSDEIEMQRYDELWGKGNGCIDLKGEILVAHVPTMMNYWHVELKIIEKEGTGKAVKGSSVAWKESIRNHVVNYLRSHSLYPSEVKDYVIPEEWYSK